MRRRRRGLPARCRAPHPDLPQLRSLLGRRRPYLGMKVVCEPGPRGIFCLLDPVSVRAARPTQPGRPQSALLDVQFETNKPQRWYKTSPRTQDTPRSFAIPISAGHPEPSTTETPSPAPAFAAMILPAVTIRSMYGLVDVVVHEIPQSLFRQR